MKYTALYIARFLAWMVGSGVAAFVVFAVVYFTTYDMNRAAAALFVVYVAGLIAMAWDLWRMPPRKAAPDPRLDAMAREISELEKGGMRR